MAALIPASASAKMISSGRIGTHSSMKFEPRNLKIAKPIKLLKCHKYGRGDGHGGTNWVTVCF
jgi:hypothetical protein